MSRLRLSTNRAQTSGTVPISEVHMHEVHAAHRYAKANQQAYPTGVGQMQRQKPSLETLSGCLDGDPLKITDTTKYENSIHPPAFFGRRVAAGCSNRPEEGNNRSRAALGPRFADRLRVWVVSCWLPPGHNEHPRPGYRTAQPSDSRPRASRYAPVAAIPYRQARWACFKPAALRLTR